METEYWQEVLTNEDTEPVSSALNWLEHEWTDYDKQECYLARQKLDSFWERTKNTPPKYLPTHKDITFSASVPERVATRVTEAAFRLRKVWDIQESGLPWRVKGGHGVLH